MTDLSPSTFVQSPAWESGQPWWVLTVLAVATASAIRGVWSPCGLSMISAINPFTERSRGHRFWLTAGWFIGGSLAGGALLGALAAIGAILLSPLSAAAALVGGIGCCLVALASDSSALGVRLPDHPRQVNEEWLGRYRRWIYAAGFGLQIGCGFATYIMTAAVYLTVLLGALSGSPVLAVAAGLAFGLLRGLAVLLSSRARTPAELRALHRRLELLGPWSMRAVLLVEALAAVVLGSVAAGPLGSVIVTVLVSGGVIAARLTGHRAPAATGSCALPTATRREPAGDLSGGKY